MTECDKSIKVEKLGKCYRIGVKEKMNDSLVSSIFNFVKKPLANFRKHRSLYKFDKSISNSFSDSNHSDIIWALKDITFEVNKGERVGIIGRNGAGKSTLLKILCKITVPTIGLARVHGKISSLLEVGTGFHQELTGRENIYLNGAVLGMKKNEIDHKFDEIVDFSGVEKFLDTPVKRYSSGMRVRLAFSVAAHLEPEILIVDEVLAVGDAEFQKKCLNKMQEVAKDGKTIIFVSHNMQALIKLCSRAILLEEGRIVNDGPAHKVVTSYLKSDTETSASREWKDPSKAPAGDVARLHAVRVVDKNQCITETIEIQDSVGIEMTYELFKSGFILAPHYHFFTEDGTHAFVTVDIDPNWQKRPRPAGYYTSIAWIPGNLLSEGIYYVHCNFITLYPLTPQFVAPDAVSFNVIDKGNPNTARGEDWTYHMPGAVRPLLKWETKYQSEKIEANCSINNL